MDQYLVMCSTPEIQGGWEPKVGDIIYGIGQQEDYVYVATPTNTKDFPNSYYIIPPSGGCHHYKFPAGVIFKPTIEQLMGMVSPCWWGWPGDSLDPVDFTELFENYITGLNDARKIPYKELLLRWIMHELHNKRWSGERWE